MLRRTAVCLLALAALFVVWSGGNHVALGDELLHVSSDINYTVNTDETSVSVTWDFALENTDPSTQAGLYYQGLTVPVLLGGAEFSATSSAGVPLSVSEQTSDSNFVDRVDISFDRALFFGDSYDFTLSYVIPETRNDAVLVTPAYYYVPLITLGDEASVTVTTPNESPWQTDLSEQDCTSDGSALQCSGSENVYVAGLLEVSRPDRTAAIDFTAPIAAGDVDVHLAYFEGEDEAAAHQRDVIQAALPLIEEAYGVPLNIPNMSVGFSVLHGGRQAVFGYEGVTTCAARCEIVISPIATDQTLIHELAHLWSNMYDSRWLSEGFAEWVARKVVDQLPDLVGDIIPYPPTSASLQLDDWGDVESLITADDDYVALTQAGYDLSLRFIQELESEVGADGLRAVNKSIAESGDPADSRNYMDALEDQTGLNPDQIFLLWVFPDSYEPLVQQRRAARDRFAEVALELADGGFPREPLAGVKDQIDKWQFDDAMAAMDGIEADLGRYGELKTDLDNLLSDADFLGLVVPESLSSALERWEFDEAETLIGSARQALGAYGRADERVNEPRSLWQKFGLVGDDPQGELDAAQESFEAGSFSRSQEQSLSAIDMIDGASSAAARRLLAIAAILGAFAVAFGIAYWFALWRQRRFGEEA